MESHPGREGFLVKRPILGFHHEWGISLDKILEQFYGRFNSKFFHFEIGVYEGRVGK